MEEYLIVSHNFRLPVDVFVAGKLVTGLVGQLVEDHAIIAGEWYPLKEMKWLPKREDA